MATDVQALQSIAALDSRLSALEAERPHLATKNDLRELEVRLIKWIVGSAIASVIGVASIMTPILLHIISRLPA